MSCSRVACVVLCCMQDLATDSNSLKNKFEVNQNLKFTKMIRNVDIGDLKAKRADSDQTAQNLKIIIKVSK